ncbi:hypothetical protein VMCG_05905 [Cytospora schulzeri]|uniref:Up-regulated during septation protein 1 domain-containing protein n=1 Tax=Cytospora schulzeri TaxID=448051 RepID=A0A423WDG4_9PEZI|nr:hypothetical protein VMCG_05905 [Valsa malicola]
MRGATIPIALLALLATTLTTPARAQFGGYAGFGGSDDGGNDSPYSAGAGADGDGTGDGDGGLGIGYDGAARARTAHGILACISNPSTNYHPIIGIVVFILLLVQPLLGIIHHRNFKVLQRRTLSSYLHVWDGRVAIILGIINGGLGLQLARAGDTLKLAYTIIAAIFGGTWIVLAVLKDLRVAHGKQTSDSQSIKDHCVPQSKPISAAPARLSPYDDVPTRRSKNPSLARSHDDNIAMDGPGHETGLLASNSFPPGKPGSLVRETLPVSPDDPRRTGEAGHCGKEVAMVSVLPLPVNGVHIFPTTLPNPRPTDNVESPPQPAPAPHRPETPSNNSSNDGDCEEDGSDLFLESGPSAYNTTDSTTNTTPASPSLTLQHNGSLPTSTSGLLGLHGIKNEVDLLLDRLMAVQYILSVNEEESMYQSGRNSALRDVQEELLRRSELFHVGTAEGRILRREAANLDGMRDGARKEAYKKLEMKKGLNHPNAVIWKLREANTRLFDLAHSALQIVESLTGQAAPEAEAATQTAQYPVWKEHHLVSLTTERRVLKSQVEKFQKDNLKQLEDISRLKEQVDDLQALQSAAITPRRDVPQSLVPGPPGPNLSLQPVRDSPGGVQRASDIQSLENGSGQERRL